MLALGQFRVNVSTKHSHRAMHVASICIKEKSKILGLSQDESKRSTDHSWINAKRRYIEQSKHN